MMRFDWIRNILERKKTGGADSVLNDREIDKDKELKIKGKKSRGDILITDDEVEQPKELGEDVYTRLTKRVTPIKGAGTVSVRYGRYHRDDKLVEYFLNDE